MPFQFRLQTVLAFKEDLEEKISGELALLNAQAERSRRAVEAVQASREDLLGEMDARRRAPRLDTEKILHDTLYLDRLNADIQIARRVLQERRAVARAKREELVGISRERRILEKLREKHQARYQRETDRKEATLADEVFLSRHNR